MLVESRLSSMATATGSTSTHAIALMRAYNRSIDKLSFFAAIASSPSSDDYRGFRETGVRDRGQSIYVYQRCCKMVMLKALFPSNRCSSGSPLSAWCQTAYLFRRPHLSISSLDDGQNGPILRPWKRPSVFVTRVSEGARATRSRYQGW
jgi:hypothetical protein